MFKKNDTNIKLNLKSDVNRLQNLVNKVLSHTNVLKLGDLFS